MIKNTFFAALLWMTTFPLWAMDSHPSNYFSDQALANIEQTYGVDARANVLAWQTLIDDGLQLSSDDEKLLLTNQFLNQMAFISDMEHWQQEDYWATPLEFIATSGGDCEDYSVAKLATLKMMGVSSEKLRLMYVKNIADNQPHMVLTYHPRHGDIPLVLDNLDQEIRPASERTDLLPIISFNDDGQWLARVQGRGGKVKEEGGAFWQELMERIEKQI
ncbi:sulfate adenylyltransferase [Corallincola holothuriorum]|uniref:Sulfate adenylyltransferase n=1 Tax=Corallincola holothuriorum TaxID=2282215 RepID=A0A368N7C2_9GAMM|nr:transglutaminase-like cysteine peptidase [Corallincola holothuriorum]RCU45481.1 sulfate adenylyltransferase [Corallincola holothuriorum]